jgi:hypothetical protein
MRGAVAPPALALHFVLMTWRLRFNDVEMGRTSVTRAVPGLFALLSPR